MTISESLKRFRKNFNLTQDDIAKVLGTSKQSYYRYEKDVTPSAEVIKKIAVSFNVSSDYLLGINDVPNNDLNKEIVDAVKVFYEGFQQIVAKNTACEKSESTSICGAPYWGLRPQTPARKK